MCDFLPAAEVIPVLQLKRESIEKKVEEGKRVVTVKASRKSGTEREIVTGWQLNGVPRGPSKPPQSSSLQLYATAMQFHSLSL